MSRSRLRHTFQAMVSGVRWYVGLVYLAAGAGAVVAGPVMLGRGNGGGLYMLIGGPQLAALGWVVHPWGLERRRRSRRLVAG